MRISWFRSTPARTSEDCRPIPVIALRGELRRDDRDAGAAAAGHTGTESQPEPDARAVSRAPIPAPRPRRLLGAPTRPRDPTSERHDRAQSGPARRAVRSLLACGDDVGD